MFNCIQLLMNLKLVYSDLSIDYINERAEKLFINEKLPLKLTVINPVFGFLADKAGLIYNIRFFSPHLKDSFKNDIRDFKNDHSKDGLTSMIIKLFPSPSGDLSISTLSETNPLKLFKIKIDDSVKFFARLFVGIIKNQDFNFDIKMVPNESQIDFENRIALFSGIKTKMFQCSEMSIFKDKEIKLLVIHSYIINALDPVVKINGISTGSDYFSMYLEEIVNNLDPSIDYNLFKNKINDELILKKAIEMEKLFNFFPYSDFNRPQSNKLIPVYDRKTDTFNENDTFSDCSDVTILQLCNCLFFKNGGFSLDYLPNASKELKSFYEKHSKVFTLTIDIRNDWSKVVQDLNKTDEFSPAKNILYIKSSNNEIKSGILNMMNVLIKISGLEENQIFDHLTEENLIEKLKLLIEILTVKENERNVVFSFSGPIIKFDTKIDENIDFTGEFQLSFKYLSGNESIINVRQEIKHSELHLKSSNIKELNMSADEIECIKNTLNERNILTQILSNFFKWNEKVFSNYKNEENLLNYFYSSGRLDNNDLKRQYLEETCLFIDKLEKKKDKDLDHEIQLLNKIGKLLIGSIELNAFLIGNDFEPYLFWISSALSNKIRDLVWSKTRSRRLGNDFINRKWDEAFTKQLAQITELENLKTELGFDTAEGVKKFLLSNFKHFKNLVKVDLSSLELDEKTLKSLLISLSRQKNLEELYLDENKLSNLPEEIGELISLKVLSVSFCEIKKFPNSIEKLIKIEKLDLSGNFIDDYTIKMIEPFKSLKSLNLSQTLLGTIPAFIMKFESLENLNFGYNEIEFIPENIRNLSNLKSLSFPATRISELPDTISMLNKLEELNIAENNFEYGLPICIKKLTQLKSLDLHGCVSNPKELKFLANFSQLNILDISYNPIEEIPKEIGSLKLLKNLDISNTRISSLPYSFINLNSLENLNISGNKFWRGLPKEIQYLTNLKSLDLSDSLVSVIPDFIIFLKNLKVLNLKSNRIEYFSVKLKDFIKDLDCLDIRDNIEFLDSSGSNSKCLGLKELIALLKGKNIFY